MNVWKSRIKRTLALALALALVCSGTNHMMLYAAEDGEEYCAENAAEGRTSEDSVSDDSISDGDYSREEALEDGISDEALLQEPSSDESVPGGETSGIAGEEDTVSGGDAFENEVLGGADQPGKEPENEIKPELIEETLDLSDWVFQEGGMRVWPDESASVFSLDGESAAQAGADLEGAMQAVVAALQNWQAQIDISSYNISRSEIAAFGIAVANRNPDLFYITGAIKYSYNPSNNMVSEVTFTIDSQYTAEHARIYQEAVSRAYSEAIPNEAGMTQAQKARALHDYLAQHMYYDGTLKKHNAYNALVEGTAVCQGYSLAYAALLKRAGIAFDYCTSDPMNHMWNYVYIDGAWYHVDVTWDDPVPDRVGYVSHNYFLCSDDQMNEGEDGHYDWVSGRSCTSTAYDNAYWKDLGGNDPLSAIFYVDGSEYYLRAEGEYPNRTLSVMKRSGTAEEKACTVSGVWMTSDGGYYNSGLFSRLSFYNGFFYFNNAKNIYRWQPGSTQPAVIYTYDGSGSIYGSFVCNDQITMETADSASEEQKTITTMPLPKKETGIITNKANGGYVTAYEYSKAAIAEPQAAQFETNAGTITFEWYKESVAAGNRLNSAPSDAGSYVLRAAAAETADYTAAVLDLKVTIVPRKVAITVSAEDKVYDGTDKAKVTAAIAGGVLSGDNVSIANPEGTFSDKNVGEKKTVNLTGGKLEGTAAANYTMDMPTTTTASIKARPITVQAEDKSMIYGEAEPALTYIIASDTPLVTGDRLTGELQRDAGGNAGTYNITQGTLTNNNNSNYSITFIKGTFTVHPAEYEVLAKTPQSIFEGTGSFEEPVARVKNSHAQVPGNFAYTYAGKPYTYEELTAELKKLPADESVEVSYQFTPADSRNYKVSGSNTGIVSIDVRDIQFVVGGAAGPSATSENAVILKEFPVYGDTWEEIVQLKNLTANAGAQTDSNQDHFKLNVSGLPDAGRQTYQVLYNGTLNGKQYTNKLVFSDVVEVGKKEITVSAGSYKVSKVYDGGTGAGKGVGTLAVSGIVASDTGVNVSVSLIEDYGNANVGGQGSVNVSLVLNGDTKGNYILKTTELEVPCEIIPKTVVPVLEVTGAYTYSGTAIIPEFTVKVEGQTLTDRDYIAELTDNINAGKGKVKVSPKPGSNYTWTVPAEAEFTIEKAVYDGIAEGGVKASFGKETTYHLAAFLAEGYELGDIQVEDNDAILEGTPVIKEGKLFFKLVDDIVKIGKTAVVHIPVISARNYYPYDVLVTVEMTDKLTQTEFRFAEAKVTKEYGNDKFTMPAAGAAEGSAITYTSSNRDVAVVDGSGQVQILAVGETVITAIASETDDYNAAEASYTLTVLPRKLSWDISGLEAVDRQGSITDKKASLYGELKVDGIVASDGDDVFFKCTADRLAGEYDTVEPGKRTVVLSWADPKNPVALEGDGAGNYVLPDGLPVLTGKINAVSKVPVTLPGSSDDVSYVLEVEEGISVVPEALRNMEELNTPSKMDAYMRLLIQEQASTVQDGNIRVYDMALMVSRDGEKWEPVTAENFPEEGLTITLPYPVGTAADTHDFFASHLFTVDMNGHKAGETEKPQVTKGEAEFSFVVYGLSPISVAWLRVEPAPEEPTTPDNPGGSENTADSDNAPGTGVLSPKTGEETGDLPYGILFGGFAVMAGGMYAVRCRRVKKQ